MVYLRSEHIGDTTPQRAYFITVISICNIYDAVFLMFQGDLTFVMYLNSDETAGFCGKTTFFDQVQDVDEGILILQDSNDEDSVTIGVVNPSYGRAVVYKGIVKKYFHFSLNL